MTYAQYNLIEASDFNTLIGNNPGNTANALNTTWAVGNADAGYGQQQVSNVEIGFAVANIDWDTLINNTANSAAHQGSTITSVTPPSGGDTITYIAAVKNNLTTIYNNRLNAVTQDPVPVSNTVTRTSTWTSNITFTQTASFANADAARYFFNAGGQLAITCDHPTGNTINNVFHALAANIGSVVLSSPTSGVISIAGNSFSGVSKLGGGGQTPSIVPNNGYYALTTSNANVFTQTDGVDPTYSSSYINVKVKSNGTQGIHGDAGNVITFYTTWQELPSGTTVLAGTTTTLTAIYPSASNLANTWGTVTLQGSLPTSTTTTTSGPVTGSGQAIFGFGGLTATGTNTNIINRVSNIGVVATDTTGVGTARTSLAAAGYGNDKAIFGFGAIALSTYTSITNKVSNTGVVATDTAGVGTPRVSLAAAGFGGDKAIFGFGNDGSGSTGGTTITNLVNNLGVVATDTSALLAAQLFNRAAASYGYDKAIFGFGYQGAPAYSIIDLVNNIGTVVSEYTSVGTARYSLAAAGYGNDKAIFGFGATDPSTYISITNLVSNLGIVATDIVGVGTARYGLAAAGYGGDKAIFGYGYTGSVTSITNLVSNTGVVAIDTSGVGTARYGLAGASFGGSTPPATTTTTTLGPYNTGKAIFGFGLPNIGTGTWIGIFNRVSSLGIVSDDVTNISALPTVYLAAAGYGGDKAIFGFGQQNDPPPIDYYNVITKVNNTGDFSYQTSGVGTARSGLAAAGYGGDKAIFGFGDNANTGYLSMTNLVNNLGVVATDTTGVGTARQALAAASYGGDKAIFGYGYTTGGKSSITNLVSNTGVIVSESAGVGSPRYWLAAASYGGDKAIFGFGTTTGATDVSITNKVSNLGYVQSDVTNASSAKRSMLAAAGYGGDKAIFGFGYGPSASRITNLINNLGAIVSESAGVGTPRQGLAAASYGNGSPPLTTTTTSTTTTAAPTGLRAIFGFGWTGSSGAILSLTNLVSDTGVVATDTAGVGTARQSLAAAGYGGDKAIFGFGDTGSAYTAITNKVSNTGVVAADTTGVGTPRVSLAAAGYGYDKAIFGFGLSSSISSTNITNLVSSAGVVATDTTGVGTARYGLAAATYDGDKAIFGYGSAGGVTAITNKVSNTGVVATDTAGVGTARSNLAAARYGGDKAIFGFGLASSASSTNITNLVSNTGVVASDTTGVGTARYGLAASGYGGDKAIFGFGTPGSGFTSITNLVSNTGVVATDTVGVGTARNSLAASSFGIGSSGTTTTTTTIAPPGPARDGKAIFGFGQATGTFNYTSVTNKVSNIGVVAANTTGVGTPRRGVAAASYGYDKAIFGFGDNGTIPFTYYSLTNLVSNLGVVATDTAGVGTPRKDLDAAGYGSGRAIFGFGEDASYALSLTNLVSDTGVVATDTAGVGTPRTFIAAASYGGDKAIFGFGTSYSLSVYFNITNLVSNTGVVATDTTGVGTARSGLAAAGYGGDKAIFGFGVAAGVLPTYTNITNLVSNTGVVATDQSALTGTPRQGLAAAGYSSDKAIFGFGSTPLQEFSITNLVTNTGIMGSDVTGVGTERTGLAAAGYDSVPPLNYVFPTPGTYSIAPIFGYPYLTLDLVGGGGGGGGNDGFSVSYAGGGGGSGGYSFRILDTTGMSGNFTVTVGAGGTAASASLNGTVYPGVPSIPRTGTKNGGDGKPSSLVYSLTNYYDARGGIGGTGNTGSNDDGVGGAGGIGLTITGNPGVTPSTPINIYPSAAGGASVYGGYGAGGASQNSNFINNAAANLPQPGGGGYARLRFSSTLPTTSTTTTTTTTTAAPTGTINTALFTYLANNSFYGSLSSLSSLFNPSNTNIYFYGNGQFRILDQSGNDLTDGAANHQYWISGLSQPGLYYWFRFTQTAVNGTFASSTTGWIQPGLSGIATVYVSNSYFGTTDATYTIEVATNASGTNIVATSTGVLISTTQNIF
jgi:hypothetical protein